jgi:hypothetical protein
MAGLLGLEAGVVEAALDDLVDVALLDWDGEVQGRYLLHPLLRQYGYDLLQQEGDVRSVHGLAAQYLREKIIDPQRDGTPDEGLEEVDQWERAEEWETFAQRASALIGTLDRLGYWGEIDERLIKAEAHLEGLGEAEILNKPPGSQTHAVAVCARNSTRADKSIGAFSDVFDLLLG